MDLPNIKRKQPTSLSISDIFDEEPSQLSESDLQYESIEKPSPVVTTDIEGGLFRGVRATSCSDLGGKQDEVVQSSIILKTVVVE